MVLRPADMTLSHLAGRDGGARAGAGVEADMVGRGVGALNVQRKGVIDIRGKLEARVEAWDRFATVSKCP